LVALAKQTDPERARQKLEKVHPANRPGKPEETAYGILYLASDESPYATEAVLSINGDDARAMKEKVRIEIKI